MKYVDSLCDNCHFIEIHCRANTILCFTEIRKDSDELFGGKNNIPLKCMVERTSCDRGINVCAIVMPRNSKNVQHLLALSALV